MAQADSDATTELTLRLHLHKAGLRLRSSGVSFEILYKNQVLLSGNAHGEALSIDDVADFSVEPERIERAIADDLAFLAAHPVRQSNRRRQE